MELDDGAANSNSQGATGVNAEDIDAKNEGKTKPYLWMVEHVIFPAFRNYLQVPKAYVDNGIIVKLATLPDLYKVFERC